MSERELWRLGRRILDLISRQGLSPAEHAELEECLMLIRRERMEHEAEKAMSDDFDAEDRAYVERVADEVAMLERMLPPDPPSAAQ